MIAFFKHILRRYRDENRGDIIIEIALLFPVLITMLMGVYDMGQTITINQKVLTASQVVGDLIARNESVTQALVEDIVKAGEMALEPNALDNFGYEIVSVKFDGDGDPVVQWRMIDNMAENADALASVVGFGAEGEGLVIVTVEYQYNPFFTHFIVGDVDMSEVSFLRGRRVSVVSCDDCPAG